MLATLSTELEEKEEISLKKALSIYKAHLEKFVEIAREHKQNPYFLIEPFYMSDGFDVLPEGRMTRTIELIYEISQKSNVPIIDLQKKVYEHRDDVLYIDDVHQNETGKHFIGHTIFKEIESVVGTLALKRLNAPHKKNMVIQFHN